MATVAEPRVGSVSTTQFRVHNLSPSISDVHTPDRGKAVQSATPSSPPSRGRSPGPYKAKQSDLRAPTMRQATVAEVILDIGPTSSTAVHPSLHQDGPFHQLLALDEKASYRLHHTGSKYVSRKVLRFLEHSGNGLLWLPLAALVMLLPLDRTLRAFSSNLELGFVVDLILVGLVKAVVKRQRPTYNNLGDYHVVNKVDHYSFPSGHASRATLVSIMSSLYLVNLPGLVGYSPVVVIAWGFLTAVSRVVMGRHYLSDVTAGVVVGIVAVMIVSMGSFSAYGMPLDEKFVATLDRSLGYKD